MQISTKGRYAIRALSHLVVSYKDKENKPVSIKEISGKEGISGRYLENIFVNLRKAGIVKSLKGEKGGFSLAKDPGQINLLEVLKAVEKGTSPTKCVDNLKICGRSSKCGIRRIWVRLGDHIDKFLKQVSLEEAAKEHFNL